VSDLGSTGGVAATDDWLDRVLVDSNRDHADAYIADDGFTRRVMNALPAPAVFPAWRRPAVTALWGVAAIVFAFALPGAAVDVAREAFKLFAAKPFTLSEIGALLAVAGLGTWTTALLALRRA